MLIPVPPATRQFEATALPFTREVSTDTTVTTFQATPPDGVVFFTTMNARHNLIGHGALLRSSRLGSGLYLALPQHVYQEITDEAYHISADGYQLPTPKVLMNTSKGSMPFCKDWEVEIYAPAVCGDKRGIDFVLVKFPKGMGSQLGKAMRPKFTISPNSPISLDFFDGQVYRRSIGMALTYSPIPFTMTHGISTKHGYSGALISSQGRPVGIHVGGTTGKQNEFVTFHMLLLCGFNRESMDNGEGMRYRGPRDPDSEDEEFTFYRKGDMRILQQDRARRGDVYLMSSNRRVRTDELTKAARDELDDIRRTGNRGAYYVQDERTGAMYITEGAETQQPTTPPQPLPAKEKEDVKPPATPVPTGKEAVAEEEKAIVPGVVDSEVPTLTSPEDFGQGSVQVPTRQTSQSSSSTSTPPKKETLSKDPVEDSSTSDSSKGLKTMLEDVMKRLSALEHVKSPSTETSNMTNISGQISALQQSIALLSSNMPVSQQVTKPRRRRRGKGSSKKPQADTPKPSPPVGSN
jgi:hypothetical protein